MAEQTKFVYNADGVPYTIYKSVKPTKSGPKTYWLLEDFSTGKRRTLNNVSRQAAGRRADQIRAATFKGKAHLSLYSHRQQQEICIALEVVHNAPAMDSLSSAVRSWAECITLLDGRATLLDAVKFYLANHRGTGPQPKPMRIDEATKLYHNFKVADGKSGSHCDNIQSRVNRLANALPSGVLLDDLTAGQLEQVVVSFGLRPKTRNEYKILLGNLYTWASKQNPPLVSKGFNPGKEMERCKVIQGDVEFLRVADLKKILARLPTTRPYAGWNGELGHLLRDNDAPKPRLLVANDLMAWPAHSLHYVIPKWRSGWKTNIHRMTNDPWPDLAPAPGAGGRRVVVTRKLINPHHARAVGAVVVTSEKYHLYRWPAGVLVIISTPPVYPEHAVPDGPGVVNLNVEGVPLLQALARVEAVCAEHGVTTVAVQRLPGFEDEAADLALWRQQEGQIKELIVHLNCDGHYIDFAPAADLID